MQWFKKNGITIALVVILILGIGIMVYPSVSDWWNSFHQSRAIAGYAEAVANMDTEAAQKMLQDAEAYNGEIAQEGIHWLLSPDEVSRYNSLLDVTGTGIMAYIEIPEIKCYLPIYHGTDESILQIAIGHIEGTSLPVGGKGSHCVLSGHRGLPSAKLFSDLDQMAEGDTFMIRTLDETLTYEVDQIRIVLPSDLSDLQIDPEQDLCTLVTCTPYGINTHRLLVRGHRVANAEDSDQIRVTADAMMVKNMVVAAFVAIPILIVLLILLIVRTSRRKFRKPESPDDPDGNLGDDPDGGDSEGDTDDPAGNGQHSTEHETARNPEDNADSKRGQLDGGLSGDPMQDKPQTSGKPDGDTARAASDTKPRKWKRNLFSRRTTE